MVAILACPPHVFRRPEVSAADIASARRAYTLHLLIRGGAQELPVAVETPYHSPACRLWTPAPAALSADAPKDVRWRVAWGRGSGDDLARVLQALLDQNAGGLCTWLRSAVAVAHAEGHPQPARLAAELLARWMQDEDLGVDALGFVRAATGLAGPAPAALAARAVEIPALLARPGDLVLDSAAATVGVVERPPRRIRLGEILCPTAHAGAQAALWRNGGDARRILEVGVAHATGACTQGSPVRLSRVWLDDTGGRLGDEADLGFSRFYRANG